MPFEWTGLRTLLFAGLAASTAVAAIVFLVLRDRPRPSRRLRRRLECPVKGRPATVEFVVPASDREAYLDVARCSLEPAGTPPDCGRVCRSLSVARFSPPADPAYRFDALRHRTDP
jgi:hypothetical protein